MELKPGYKETEVGVIPEDWSPKTLGEFISLRRGHDLTERDRRPGEVPVMGSAGQNGFHDTALAKGPGVVLGRSGASFGQAHFCEADFWPHNTALYVTDFHGNNPHFVFYFLRSFNFSRHNSGGAQQSLNRNFIAPTPVAVPPLPEQEAIAEALSDADALIESLEQLIATKCQIKQGATQELLTGKKRLPGFATKPGYKQTEVGVIPEDWEVRPLEQLGSWRGGATPSMQNSAFWANGTIPWVSSGDVKLVSISDAPMKITDYAVRNSSTTVLPTDSIIIVVRSGILRKYLPVSQNTCPLAINQDIKALIPAANLVPSYLLYLLTWSGPKILATCLKSGTTVESLEFRWLKSFRIPLPPSFAEKEAIAAILSNMDAEIAALEAKLAKTRQLKQGMMRELLTGRIRLV